MRRREFLGALGGAATTWPVGTRAQQTDRMRRIGVLMALAQNDALAQSYVTLLRQSLRALDWEENRNLHIEFRWAGDNAERARSLAVELVSFKPEVIFAQSGLVLPALKQATQSIPIVFVQVVDPVASGFVQSLARPGGNMTGFANAEFATAGKMLDVLKEVAPAIDRAAVIMNPEQPPQIGMMRAIEGAAASLRIVVTSIGARDPSGIERSIEAFTQKPGGGLIVLPNPVTNRHRDLIIALAARHRVPAIYRYRHFVASGGLISYGERVDEATRGAASYIDRILRGAKIGDLPVQQPTKFEMVINLKIANAIGLNIPPSFLLRADEVIE